MYDRQSILGKGTGDRVGLDDVDALRSARCTYSLPVGCPFRWICELACLQTTTRMFANFDQVANDSQFPTKEKLIDDV